MTRKKSKKGFITTKHWFIETLGIGLKKLIKNTSCVYGSYVRLFQVAVDLYQPNAYVVFTCIGFLVLFYAKEFDYLNQLDFPPINVSDYPYFGWSS